MKLNEHSARYIFQRKELLLTKIVSEKAQREILCKECKSLANEFGVSLKTIRDVWNYKTWLDATLFISDKESEIPSSIQQPLDDPFKDDWLYLNSPFQDVYD
jgi:hypothetical protein